MYNKVFWIRIERSYEQIKAIMSRLHWFVRIVHFWLWLNFLLYSVFESVGLQNYIQKISSCEFHFIKKFGCNKTDANMGTATNERNKFQTNWKKREKIWLTNNHYRPSNSKVYVATFVLNRTFLAFAIDIFSSNYFELTTAIITRINMRIECNFQFEKAISCYDSFQMKVTRKILPRLA